MEQKQTWTVILIVLIVILVVSMIIWLYFSRLNYVENLNSEHHITTSPQGYTAIEDDYDEPTIIKDVVTPYEAQYIIDHASDKFTKSLLVGDILDKNIRDSETCWISKSDKIVGDIIKRISIMVNKPFENAEDLQVVKYKLNGLYRPHHDACCDDNNECNEFLKRGGQRIITVVIYLTDDFEGGETNFPNLNKKYKPPKYSGIMFYPLDKTFKTCHPKALHEGTPVTRGTKIICNVWFRESTFV
jgi:prolyl 4-hydroxylase